MSGSVNQVAFLLMETVFAVLMFTGCYFSYVLPIRILQNKKLGHQRLQEGPHSHEVNQVISVEDCGHEHGESVLEESEEKAERVIGYCNCFGAGVFVAVCFLTVLPVVHEEFDAYFKLVHMDNVHYPVAEFTTLIGFFLILFLEEAMSLCSRHHDRNPVLYLDDVMNEGEEGASAGLLTPDHESFEELKLEDGHRGHQARHAGHGNSHPHSHSHSHVHIMSSESSGFSFFILMFATSIHSIFEGMALGLIQDYTRAIHLFIGIILHECIVAVALGLNSFRIPNQTSANKFALIFSSTIPAGILIGVIVGYTPGAFGRLTSAVFQGLAAGTFLHVAFCELIPGELNSRSESPVQEAAVDHEQDESRGPAVESGFQKKRIFRVILIFLGFVFMSFVTLFIDH